MILATDSEKAPEVGSTDSRMSRLGVGEYIDTTLRSVNLELLSPLTGWKQLKERPKVAIYKNKNVAILHSLMHVVPFGIAVALITMNLHGMLVDPPAALTPAALQFFAKLLEVSMQASLAAMLLSVVRDGVIKGNRSLPLGVLVAPVNSTNISYLWSLEFWGSLTSPVLSAWQRAFLSVVIITTFLLCALVGPSGAALLIPRPSTFSSHQEIRLFDNETSLYPPRIELRYDNVSSSNGSLK